LDKSARSEHIFKLMRTITLRDIRTSSLAVAALLLCSATSALAEVTNPYEARIVVASAPVRSGPGERFYSTETLAEGETVEVYREHADGWLAIRPSKSSFSWVFGRHLRMREDGFGIIEKDEVASRIGSQFDGQRNAVQVKLRRGEVVEVLDKDSSGGETWYKIAPPAGEFRWIYAPHAKRVRSLAISESERDGQPIVVATSANEESDAADNKTIDASGDTTTATPDATPDETWRAASADRPSASDDMIPPPLSSSESAPPTTTLQQTTEPANGPAPGPADLVSNVSGALGRRLTEIELRLSRMVAAPTTQWNTERLERDAEALLAQAQSPAERDAVKATLAKMDQFKAIGQRYQQMTANGTIPGTPSITPISQSLDGPTEGDGRYDAVGVLRPVVSKRPGAPRFALVDERGQVISFVTPTPDMNLQPYLGHRVGVVGNRGFIPEFHRAHVTAGRVTPLGERLVR
jgi:uncharacterized protein YgiM (DUF1202 family)